MKKFITILLLFASFTSYSQIKTIKIRGDSNLIKASVYYMLDSAIAAHGGVSVVTASAPLSITSTPTLTPNVVADTTTATTTALVNQRQLSAATAKIGYSSSNGGSTTDIGFLPATYITPNYKTTFDTATNTSYIFSNANTVSSSSLRAWADVAKTAISTYSSAFATTFYRNKTQISNDSSGLILGSDAITGEILLSTGGAALSKGRMKILSHGGVGIGDMSTLTPIEKLSVYSNGNFMGFYDSTGNVQGQVFQSTGTTSRQLMLNTPGVTGVAAVADSWAGFRFNGAANKIFFGDDATNSWMQTNHPLRFSVGGSLPSTASTPVMTLTSTGLGIGITSPATSAILDITSTTKGVLPPRMTTTQRNAIGTPAEGLTIYNTTDSILQFKRTSGWVSPITGPTGATLIDSPQHVYTPTDTWVGTTAPSGASNKTYQWTQVGKLVTLRINIWYTTAGAALTQLTLPLPADCPAPLVPTGYTTNDYFGAGTGGLKTAHGSIFATPYRVGLRNIVTTNAINIFASSGAYISCDIVIQYFVP